MVFECMFCGKKPDSLENVTLHKFPSDEESSKKWLDQMGLPNFNIAKNMRLCSQHFVSSALKQNKRYTTLKNDAVPTIFDEEYKNSCVYCKAKKGGCNRQFHRFPLHDDTLTAQWLTNMDKKEFRPTSHSLLCSSHFEDSCYRPNTGRSGLRIKLKAIPTIFSNASSSSFAAGPQSRQQKSLHTYEHERHELSDLQAIIPNAEDAYESVGCEKRPRLDSIKHVASEILTEDNRVASLEDPTVPMTPKTARKIVARDHQYTSSPRSTRKSLAKVKKQLALARSKTKKKHQKIKRLQKKVATLQDIVKDLRQRKSIPESGLASLESIADLDVKNLLQSYLKQVKTSNGVSREKYPPALRCFAQTLHFYSAKAYAYVRKKFHCALPHPRTLRSWYSSVNGDPGFTSESFAVLQETVNRVKENGERVLVSLMLDEMGIKKGLQRQPNGTIKGYVDIGVGHNENDSDELILAKDALVLMVVSLNSNWKIPIAYFLINGIDADTNAQIVDTALRKLHDIGVEVVSLTLDCPPQHFSMMKILGAKFDIDDTRPSFKHPSSEEQVQVIFDPCHMLKLIRNCLESYKVLYDRDGKKIEWSFIESLAKLQEEEGLKAGNRLSKNHIQFKNMIMKVSLAAQTFSNSVADAITFCDKQLHLPQFKNSDATVTFIKNVDRLFDFLNSRNPLGKGFKAPLRTSNESFWRPQVLSIVDYLKGIKSSDGKLMWKSRRYVPFVGFATAVQSVIQIFDRYVKAEESTLKYLLTYKLSQDHLELFFCAIRSCGGWCPNPTCLQFSSAYKRLLIRHEVQAVNGNVEAMDNTAFLTVSSSSHKRVNFFDTNLYEEADNIRISKKYGLSENTLDEADNDLFYDDFVIFEKQNTVNLSNFTNACVVYIAGWVVRKLIHRANPIIKCEKCRLALVSDPDSFDTRVANTLLIIKNKGGLIYPSESVIRICNHSEILFRRALNSVQWIIPQEKNFCAVLCGKVLSDLFEDGSTLFPELNDHLFDNAIDELNHVYYTAKQVCAKYISLRLFAATKKMSNEAIGTKTRHRTNRRLIWEGQ